MKRIIVSAWLISCTALGLPFTPPPMPAPAVNSNLQSGNQYYDMSISGLGRYLESVQTAKPDVYSAMIPDYESIKRSRNIGLATQIVSGIVAVVLEVGAVSFLRNEVLEYDGTVSKQINVNAATLGLGVGVIGFGAGMFLYPHRSDYLNFINKHNKLEGVSPLNLNLGWNPANRSLGMTAGISLQ